MRSSPNYLETMRINCYLPERPEYSPSITITVVSTLSPRHNWYRLMDCLCFRSIGGSAFTGRYWVLHTSSCVVTCHGFRRTGSRSCGARLSTRLLSWRIKQVHKQSSNHDFVSGDVSERSLVIRTLSRSRRWRQLRVWASQCRSLVQR